MKCESQQNIESWERHSAQPAAQGRFGDMNKLCEGHNVSRNDSLDTDPKIPPEPGCGEPGSIVEASKQVTGSNSDVHLEAILASTPVDFPSAQPLAACGTVPGPRVDGESRQNPSAKRAAIIEQHQVKWAHRHAAK